MDMFERFTDRARRVLALANQEAQRFNHEYIGTEHILLGIVKEGGGVAANVLRNMNLDLRHVRLEIEKLVKTGPDMVTMGKLPQTPRAKRVIDYAIEEARALNHNYVGTEHILLGIIRERDGVAAQALMNLGVKLESTREEIIELISKVGIEVKEKELKFVTKEELQAGKSLAPKPSIRKNVVEVEKATLKLLEWVTEGRRYEALQSVSNILLELKKINAIIDGKSEGC